MSIQVAVENDDLDRFIVFLEEIPETDQRIVNTGDGEKVSLLWAAASYDAEEICRYLVASGANPRGGGAVAAEDAAAAMGHLRALRGMLRGGLDPNLSTIVAFWSSISDADFPLSSIVETAIRISPAIDCSDFEEMKGIVRSSDSFKEKFSVQISVADKLEQQRLECLASPALSEVAHLYDGSNFREEIDLYVEVLSTVIFYSKVIVFKNHRQIIDIIRKEFYGYKNTRNWWEKAKSRAVSRVSEIVAELVDRYEDDEIVTITSEYILAKLPIKSIVAGIGSKERCGQNSGLDFEISCANILEQAGYYVKRTGQTGDQGADIIAQFESITYVIQCKDLAGSIGNSAVQEVIAAREFYKADYGIVCANSNFTKSARNLATEAGIILVNPESLCEIKNLVCIFE